MFRKLAVLVGMTLVLGTSAAIAQEDRGTAEQRAACAPDAFRLCIGYIPDPTGVEACLRQRRSDLSEACGVIFDQAAAAAASIRTMEARRHRGAKDEE